MNTMQKTAVIAIVLALGAYTPRAFATSFAEARENRKEARQEAREAKKNLFEQFKERFSSRAAEVKNFMSARVNMSNAKITAKTDTALTVEKDGKSYTVNLDAKTQIRRKFWGKSELSEFSIGNVVNIIGIWTDDAHTTITARLIRNLSIQKRFGVFFGEVKSVLGNGWVMSTKSENRADQTVTVTGNTKFENRKGETIARTDVVVGHKVRVRGLWDKSQNTVTEVTQVKDFSLPAVPEVTVTATATVTPTP